jgi:hypothetical protein
MANTIPVAFYKQRIAELTAEQLQLNKRKGQLAWFRFLSIMAAITSAWLLQPFGVLPVLVSVIAFIGLFIYFLKKDINKADSY